MTTRKSSTTKSRQHTMTQLMNQEAGNRAMLRHTVATLAYRGGKAVMKAPPGFAQFAVSKSTRTPAAILAHRTCETASLRG